MVGTSDKETTADDIADGDRNKVAKHTTPEIITRSEKAGRNVIHIGDGVLKTADDEGGDWENNSEDFAGNGFGGGGQPDSKAD